jgi:hypothetical protein
MKRQRCAGNLQEPLQRIKRKPSAHHQPCDSNGPKKFTEKWLKSCDKLHMSSSSINVLSSYLHPVLYYAVSSRESKLNGITPSAVQSQDVTQLSPVAKLLSELQQLQQSDPVQYQKVTQQVATNLESAAQTAQAGGNTTAANQLNQLATDFSNASQTGQLPATQGLAQAVSGHHHHHTHSYSNSDTSSTDNVNSSDSTSSSASSSLDTSLLLNQYQAAYQASGTQSDPQNPLGVILNTLSSAGISVSSS